MGRMAIWLGAALVLAGCAPLTELPRPPAVATQGAPELPPPALAPEVAPEPAPAPITDPAPAAPVDGPIAFMEETVAAFEAPAKPKKKKRKTEED